MNHVSAIARLAPLPGYFLLQIVIYILPATAQIVPDNTLGNESSIVTPDTINGIDSDRIDGGAIRNSNLFHSFQEFNINEGRGAYFSNPSGIDNIFTRVTGSNLSNIFGTLGVLGNANLFLLNPNGIVFGPNSRLDIGGSFIGSSADRILFDNGLEFSATNPQAVPLLTVNIPIGLNFRDNPGTIINQSVGLKVSQGQTLGLFGGNIELPGGNLTAPGGHIELGSITTAGTIGITSENNALRFSFPDPPLTPLETGGDIDPPLTPLEKGGDISLNQATLSVIDRNNGSITINAGNLDILESSRLIAGIQTSLGSTDSQSGDITLNATNQLTINNSVVGNQVGFEAVGNGGNVNINTGSLVLSDAGEVNTLTLGTGNAGIVSIQADSVTLTGNNTAISSNVDIPDSFENPDSFNTRSVGNSGGVAINTGNLTLNNGAQIQSSTFGNGNAGGVTVQAEESVSLSDFNTAIFSNVSTSANGNSGGIQINGRSLSMTDGAQLQSTAFGNGNSGKVQITTQDSVNLSGTNTAIFSNALLSSGSGGIEITGASLSMTDGAQLVANSEDQGIAGTISISTPQGAVSLSDRNTAILSQSSSSFSNTGEIGGINIDAASLTLRNGAQIQSEGNSASVFVQTNGEAGAISLSGADTNILTNLTEGTGGIDLNSRDFSLTDGAQLTFEFFTRQ
jgi:filamentous hemagglutinin family protein